MILFIKHIDIEGPETLGTFFEAAGFTLETVSLHQGERLPSDLTQLDAVISLGGPMNVYEEEKYPFLKDENLFLRQVLAQKVPFLGICLGSQLLSKAAGGKVVSSPEKEIGWFDVALTRQGSKDPLFAGLPLTMEVYQWHGDMCSPPASAVLLASSAGCPVQAFRCGVNAYGLQFHAEITDKSIQDWSIAECHPERKNMLEHYRRVKSDFDTRARVLCENFLKIMKNSSKLSS
ncbi:MAG: type 1 glutamine amidotransferase [Candidatus Omnitrophica bacterium]|nr:type 1 glutamine amidotransferase [Candidatus Omnitrophota bacterium]